MSALLSIAKYLQSRQQRHALSRCTVELISEHSSRSAPPASPLQSVLSVKPPVWESREEDPGTRLLWNQSLICRISRRVTRCRRYFTYSSGCELTLYTLSR